MTLDRFTTASVARGIAHRAALAIVLPGLLAAQVARTEPPATTLAGDPVRGEIAYTRVYRCYACHGYDGQSTGTRLVPLRFDQMSFIAFVRNPPVGQMPSYAAVPLQDLADVHAYVASLPLDAPELEQIPLLKGILDRQQETLTPR